MASEEDAASPTGLSGDGRKRPRQPLTLPEDGGFAASIAKARHPARGATEPDEGEVSGGH